MPMPAATAASGPQPQAGTARPHMADMPAGKVTLVAVPDMKELAGTGFPIVVKTGDLMRRRHSIAKQKP